MKRIRCVKIHIVWLWFWSVCYDPFWLFLLYVQLVSEAPGEVHPELQQFLQQTSVLPILQAGQVAAGGVRPNV